MTFDQKTIDHNVKKLYSILSECRLCGHNCMVNRTKGNLGNCKCTDEVLISSYNLHFGEEPPISGHKGSGTIFFTRCNLNCVYCQNYPISQFGHGNKITVEKLVSIMMELEKSGAHNINFVSPTHYMPMIANAIYIARKSGMRIPTVYNCGGYDSKEAIRLMEGLIDIYMPDAKYSDSSNALKYSNAPEYPEVNSLALKEMHSQVGDLKLDDEGVAVRGLLVRHLVLPNNITRSKGVLDFIAKEISKNSYVSIMSQYHPAYKTADYPGISRKLTKKEYKEVVDYAEKLGLENSFVQRLHQE